MRVLHCITRMIVGGAQENTLFNCLDLAERYQDEVLLVTGPSLGAEGDLLSRMDTKSVRVEVIDPLRRNIHPKHDFKAYHALQKMIRTWKPDVVHTHSAKAGLLGRAAAWKSNVPAVVHTVHGAPFHPYQRAMSRWFFIACERWAANRCHRLISVADAMTDLMVSARVAPREKFTTIYSGMDVEPFLRSATHRTEMRHQLGFKPDDIVFGKIARLFHLKGHEYVFAAARRVIEHVPTAKFLMVGDGLLRDAFEAQIAHSELAGRIVFTGLVSPSEIPKYLSAMDVLVHASLREGLARALPQALIAGKPAISFDIDGAREVVINGATGCLVPACDVDRLAKAMIELGLSADQRHAFGHEGRQRFTDRFRHETMTERIRAEYQRILNSHASRGSSPKST